MEEENQSTETEAQPLETDEESKVFMTSSFGSGKASKEKELNSSMSITNTSPDELTEKLRGGMND